MKIYPIRVLISFCLIANCVSTWLWMLGFFSVPPGLSGSSTAYLEAWSDPGILIFPASISILMGLAGFVILLFSYSEKPETNITGVEDAQDR